MVNDWPHIGYSTTPDLHTYSQSKLRGHILWYSLPWSFEEFFQLSIPSRCIHEREIYASPSSSNKIIPSNVQTLNGRGDMTFLLNPPDLRTITLEYRDQGHFHHILTQPSV